MCTTILVSASSWSQSFMGTDIPHEDTDFSDVAYTAFVGGQLNASIFDVRYANNSFLFILSARNSSHGLVIFAEPDTFLRTYFPLLSRVDSFKLSSMYSSYTISNLVVT